MINFDNGQEIRLKLEDIDSVDISFTYGDSMAQMERNAQKPLFLKETLYKLMSSYGSDVDRLLSSIREPYGCIEAQLWTDKYFFEK